MNIASLISSKTERATAKAATCANFGQPLEPAHAGLQCLKSAHWHKLLMVGKTTLATEAAEYMSHHAPSVATPSSADELGENWSTMAKIPHMALAMAFAPTELCHLASVASALVHQVRALAIMRAVVAY